MRASAIAAAQASLRQSRSGMESAREVPRSARIKATPRMVRCFSGTDHEVHRERARGQLSSWLREEPNRGLYLPLPTRVEIADQAEEMPLEAEDSQPSMPVSIEDCRARVKVMLENPASGRGAAFIQYTMFIVIMAAVTCAICETIPDMEHELIFHLMEPVFTAVFTCEISMRWWISDSNWDFFSSPFSIIDLLATLPGYIDIVLPLLLSNADSKMAQAEKHKRIISMNSLRAIRLADLMRIVRLLRVLRVANTMRQWEMINVVLRSIYGSLQGILVLISFTTVGTILSSTVAYIFEMGDETKFTSIPASMWWAASTITAVGYGDLVPTTVGGKLTAVTTMFLGTIIMAVCIAVITNSFTIQYQRELYLARMRRLKQQAEDSGHASHEPMTPQRARLYNKNQKPRDALSREPSKQSAIAIAAPELDGDFDGAGGFELEAQNNDIASYVTELEEMTEALMLTFEAYLDQGESRNSPGSSKFKQSGLGRVALEMLRKNSANWFDQARNFSQELATWATDDTSPARNNVASGRS